MLPPRLAGFGGKGIRTPDFQLAKLALYQLSYAPAFRIAECRLAIADFKRNSFPGFLLSLLDLPPLPETVFGFNHNHIVFLDHRHQFLLEFFFPKFAFVELGLERVAAFEIGKSAHKEKVPASATDKHGPRLFLPIFGCSGTLLDSNISRNSARRPGF